MQRLERRQVRVSVSEVLEMGFDFITGDNEAAQRIRGIVSGSISAVHSFLNQLLNRYHSGLKLIQQGRSPQSKPFSSNLELFKFQCKRHREKRLFPQCEFTVNAYFQCSMS